MGIISKLKRLERSTYALYVSVLTPLLIVPAVIISEIIFNLLNVIINANICEFIVTVVVTLLSLIHICILIIILDDDY